VDLTVIENPSGGGCVSQRDLGGFEGNGKALHCRKALSATSCLAGKLQLQIPAAVLCLRRQSTAQLKTDRQRVINFVPWPFFSQSCRDF
jgi:hypothetical protein